MKKIRLFFTAIMVLMTAVLAEAQTSQVTGTVYDAATKEPLPGVRVQGTGHENVTTMTFEPNYLKEEIII